MTHSRKIISDKMAEQGCEHCKLVQNKNNLLYEDDKLVAIVPEKPLAKGHIRIVTKTHHTKLQDIDDKEFQRLFYAASFGASALFENLKAQGTNIIFNTGGPLKDEGHFHIDLLARWFDDDINFIWKPSKLSEDELNTIQSRIKDKCDMIGVKKKGKKVVKLDKAPEKLEFSEEKPNEPAGEKLLRLKKEEAKANKGLGNNKKRNRESYLIKQLKRIP